MGRRGEEIRRAGRLTRAARVAFVAAALVAGPARADFDGRVGGVADGDSLTVLVARRQVRVRLAGIDAPERHQPYGRRSRESLSELVYRRQVTVVERGTDGYGRTLGRVVVDGRDVNAEQVRRGMAWVYARFAHDPALDALEADARQARRGLWADASPVPPWRWREAHPRPPGAASPATHPSSFPSSSP